MLKNNNKERKKSQRQINMLCPRFKDALSVKLRSNLPAGHSMHLLTSEEALTNHPGEHGSNLNIPTLWLANPDCLKADSSWCLTRYNREMSIYSGSPCPKPLKWKARRIKKSNRYLGGLTIKKKIAAHNIQNTDILINSQIHCYCCAESYIP